MKHLKQYIIIIGLLIASNVLGQSKIGNNPQSIGESSLLELESTNKALVLTRVADTLAITNPVAGMLIYDISSDCIRARKANEWTGCGLGDKPIIITPQLLRFYLTSSQGNYDAAANGAWVNVTQAEYDNIATNLNNITRFGTAEANVRTGASASFGNNAMFTFGHTNNPSPTNSYIFAFKVATSAVIGGNNDIVRLSSANNGSGFNPLGNALPNGAVYNEQQFFVIKGASILYNNPMYLGLSTDSNNPIYYNATGSTGYYASGSVTTVGVNNNYGWSMQGLATTTIQW